MPKYNGSNIVIQKSIIAGGNITVSGSKLTSNGYMIANKDISFNTSRTESKGDKGIVICSEEGNISFKGSSVNLKGIIYAPKGTVTINSANFTLNGRIIADKIVLNGSSINVEIGLNDLDLIYPLKLQGNVIDDKLSLIWNEISGVTKYKVLEASNLYDFSVVSEINLNTISIPTEGKTGIFTYRIIAYNNEYAMQKSNLISVLFSDGKALIVDKDSDGDGLTDQQENDNTRTDKLKYDTDGDGLSDGYEVFYLYTNPLKDDSDDDGLSDGNEDNDGDGLKNFDEQKYGTDPMQSDTDGDGLSDGIEVNEFDSSPFIQDTDEDGLSDYDEWVLGLNPNLIDSDGNGIMDRDEKIEQTVIKKYADDSIISAVEVTLVANGNIKDTTKIRSNKSIDALTGNVTGLKSHPYEINSTAEFENAMITFKYDSSQLGETNEEDLIILWYDEENDTFVEVPSHVDTTNDKICAETTHFSQYMVVDSKYWYAFWRSPFDYRFSESKGLDIVFAIDSSGSMSWNDPNNIRKDAAKRLVDVFYPEDQGAVVDWDSSAYVIRQLTKDLDSIKIAIDTIDSSGGTAISKAIDTSINELLSTRAIADNDKIIILLTDGEDSSNLSNVTNRAKLNNIKIFSIGLGSSVNHEKLNRLSSETGGEYYRAFTSQELIDVFEYMKGKTVLKIDTTDTDNDGLYDVFEQVGMVLSNGQRIYTDPFNADTDGDNVSDGNEILPTYVYKLMKTGGTSTNWPIFYMKSNPTLKDTDGDWIEDDIDVNPMKKETIETLFELSDKNSDTNPIYIDIIDNTVKITAHIRFTGDANDTFPGTSKTYAQVAVEGIESKWKKDITSDPITGTDYDFVPGLKGELITTVLDQIPGQTYFEKVGQKHLNIHIDNESPSWWDENLWAIFGEKHIPHMEGGWSITDVGKITMYNRDQRSTNPYTELQYAATVAHEFGHTLGLGDAYPGANNGKVLVNNAEISDGTFGISGSIMFRNGLVYSNDIEMVLEAFSTNEWQYAISHEGGWFGIGKITKSRVIRLPQTFK